VRRILFRLGRRVKLQIRRLRRETHDKFLAVRCRIVLLADRQQGTARIAQTVECSRSCVNRVLARFRQFGLPALYDGRADNGTVKADEHFLAALYDVVDGNPQVWGFARPTWTQELLARVMHLHIGVRVHRSTLSRALATIGARLGRPRPTVGCPWPKAAKTRRLNQIQRLVDGVPPEELIVYEDEVDIHLNPKIGVDWMNRGTQKRVMTPGNNVKSYLAGALDAATGQITWVKAEKKNSLLFVELLHKLAEKNPRARKIHLILDNFKIHTSKATTAAVEALEGRIVLHFLPPYSPECNRIERLWLDLHANVTRNHRCRDMPELMRNVYNYLRRRNLSRDRTRLLAA
jgi:transposase